MFRIPTQDTLFQFTAFREDINQNVGVGANVFFCSNPYKWPFVFFDNPTLSCDCHLVCFVLFPFYSHSKASRATVV